MRSLAKKTLTTLGLLLLAQEIHYRLSFLNKKSMHPRKLVFLFYRQFIRRKDLTFDVGANVGERVSIFDELGARVVAVEPQVNCIKTIKEKFRSHSNVYIENIGLGAARGEMDFFICDEDDRLSTFSTDQMEKSFFTGQTKWNRKEVIPILTMEDLISKYGIPSFCKIDVEGFEVEVLKGLRTPIRAISFEFSSKQMDKANDCMDLLSRLSGKYRFNVCFGEPYALHYKDWVEKEVVLREIEQQDKTAATHAWGDIYAQLLN
jgi:FkbM family methyltransferase